MGGANGSSADDGSGTGHAVALPIAIPPRHLEAMDGGERQVCTSTTPMCLPGRQCCAPEVGETFAFGPDKAAADPNPANGPSAGRIAIWLLMETENVIAGAQHRPAATGQGDDAPGTVAVRQTWSHRSLGLAGVMIGGEDFAGQADDPVGAEGGAELVVRRANRPVAIAALCGYCRDFLGVNYTEQAMWRLLKRFPNRPGF